jgi:hypothetical protein
MPQVKKHKRHLARMIITPSYKNVKLGKDMSMFVPTSVPSDLEKEKNLEIFKKYQNKENWKYPPRPARVKTEIEAQKIADAFEFFLGGAEIKPVDNGFIATSKGYYYYIGG